VLATGTLQPVCIGLFASVSGHIWAASESVNAFLQFYFKGGKKLRILRFRRLHFDPPQPTPDLRSGGSRHIAGCLGMLNMLLLLPSHDTDR
jgi:hypothetical protein